MIKYKTFDSLLASVESDLNVYADQGYIERANFIKDVRRVNADLGLKLNSEKETILDVKNYKSCVPDDFMYLQAAIACHITKVTTPRLGGAHTEDITMPLENKCHTCNNTPCTCKFEFKACDGNKWVVQKIGIKTETFEHLEKLSLTKASHRHCADNCLNFHFKSPHQIDINDNEATFSFREGKVYINYLSDMTDEEGNLLILDHPLVNDYYEYAVKKKFFENMSLNKEGDFINSYRLVKEELRQAKIRAIDFINIPEFDEIQDFYERNRRKFYNDYVRYFSNEDQGYYKP
jgi:hypothetical protein